MEDLHTPVQLLLPLPSNPDKQVQLPLFVPMLEVVLIHVAFLWHFEYSGIKQFITSTVYLGNYCYTLED